MKIGGFVPRFAGGVRVNRRVAVVGVLTVATILALNLYASANPTPAQRLLASLLLACCALPTLMWASDRQWPHSFMPLLGTLYALYFGLPIFLRSQFLGAWTYRPLIDAEMITAALLLALAGWGGLLLGYFGQVGCWATRKLPQINILSTARVSGLKAFAVTLGLVAAPFLYLDNSNVAAFYTGQDLLAPALAFPVIFVGQTTVLSILILFYLRRRGELGRAGKSFLWGLVTCYTVLGLSTGITLHGLPAIAALYMGTIITAPVPTWRVVSMGVIIAAILLFVLLPLREYFRVLIWTHGVAPRSSALLRKEVSVLSKEDIAIGHTNFVRASYSLVFRDNALTYIFMDDSARCGELTPDNFPYSFFLHIYPVEEEIAHDSNDGYPYMNRDFSIYKDMLGSDCKYIHNIKLPPYDIKYLITGLLDQRNAFLFSAEAGGSKRISRRKTLTSFEPKPWRTLNENGAWYLRTRDATTWELGPYLFQRQLLIVAANARERNELISLIPGDRLQVTVDADNWGEYRLDHVPRAEEREERKFQVSFRLRELIDSAGSPSLLRKNVPASLSYRSLKKIPPDIPARSRIFEETRKGSGRNPWAPEAHTSQATKVLVLGRVLWDFVRSGPDISFYVHYVKDRVSRRTDLLLPFAWVIGQTPENVPYLRGESYAPILFKLAPRFIFPDKIKDMKNLGQRYRFLPEGNSVNAFKLHQITELYANFGPWGVVLGMFALGILYRVIYTMFFHPGASVMRLAVGTHILTVLLVNMESTASVSWGFVLWYCVFLLFLDVTARVGWSWMGRAKLTKRPTTASSTK